MATNESRAERLCTGDSSTCSVKAAILSESVPDVSTVFSHWESDLFLCSLPVKKKTTQNYTITILATDNVVLHLLSFLKDDYQE